MANPEQARHAFTSAFSFHEAAIRCADTPGIEAPKGVSDLPGPHAVCLAFAAELYLKAVILRRLSKQESHNLKWLFNEGLNPAERDAVIAEFEKQKYVPVSELPHLLENFQRTFEQWRYLYEHPTMELQVGGLAAFTCALYHAVRSFEPAWEIPATIHERISANNKNKKLITVHVGEDLNLPPHILDLLWKVGIPHPNFAKLKRNYFGVTILSATFGQSPTTFEGNTWNGPATKDE